MKNSAPNDVSGVALSLPQFWSEAPALWFAQAEAQFYLRHITSPMTKFYYIIASLPASLATKVDDLVTPKTDDPYTFLKTQLLARFGSTSEERFRTLMEPTNDDQLKPTEVLRNMRRAGETLLDPNGPLMERLFLERLPRNIRLLLKAGVHESLDALAARADELVEIDESTTVNTVSPKPNAERHESLEQAIDRLEQEIRELRLRSPVRTARRITRRKSPRQRSPLCFYHSRFGPNARKCRPPCSFQGNCTPEA